MVETGLLVAGDEVHLVARPNELIRIPVAIEAPRHRQGRLLVDERHLVDRPVAGRTADTLLHVDAVIEIDEVGQVVHARPVQGRVVAETGPDRLQDRRLRPDLRVAVHAGLGRRNVGKGRLFDRRVAVPAVDPHAADVVGVTELDRLLDERIRDGDRLGAGVEEHEVPGPVCVLGLTRVETGLAEERCMLIAEKIGYSARNIHTDQRLYHAGEDQLLAVVHGFHDGNDEIMIFAHNPGLTDFANRLNHDLVTDNIPTCGVVALQFAVNSWKEVVWEKGKLLFFDFPKNTQ